MKACFEPNIVTLAERCMNVARVCPFRTNQPRQVDGAPRLSYVPGRAFGHQSGFSKACVKKSLPRSRICAQSSPNSGRPLVTSLWTSPTFKVQLIRPTDDPSPHPYDKLLVYLPGTDGTGQAILPQLPALRSLGYDVWCLYLPPDDRSDWEQLTTQVTLLLRQLLQHWAASHPHPHPGLPTGRTAAATGPSAVPPSPRPPPSGRATIIAESFGCCLALRLAASGVGPELLDRMVLLNPATSFKRSLSGLSALIAATNLLSLFPRDWYAVAQTTMLPLLVEWERVEAANQRLLQSMVLMEPPASSQSFGFGGARPPGAAPATPASPSSASSFSSFAAGTGNADDGAWAAPTWGGERDTDSPYPQRGSSSSSSSSGSSVASATRSRSAGRGANGGAGDGGNLAGTLYYGPAAAANFRANLLREGDPGEEVLRRVGTPVLLVTSARDRLLPSIIEGARLERLLPNARRYMLPDSGHAAMLERGFNMAAVMGAAGFADSQEARRIATQYQQQQQQWTQQWAQPPAPQRPLPLETLQGAAGGASETAWETQYQAQQQWSAPASELDASGYHLIGSGDGSNDSGSAEASGQREEAVVAAWAAAAAAQAPGAAEQRAAQQQQQWAAGPTGTADARLAGTKAQAGGKKKAGGGAGGRGEGGEDEPTVDIDSAFDEWCQTLAPWRDVVSPVMLGTEHLPTPGSPDFSRPMLFVGNHQKMGFYDTPLLVYELYLRGYRVRGLAHPGHWAGPMGRWFESFGSVKASPMAAFRLLKAKEKVLLFPGGAKEVVKKRGQEYTLLWKDTPDFVRLASRCDALIVPFAAVGADDAYEVIMDTDEVIAHPVLGPLTRGLLSRVSSALDPTESIFPITKLPVVGLPTPIPIPNLQRLYFQFAPPVDTRALRTNINDAQQVQELYDGIKGTVTQCMAELLAVRDADEESQLGARLAKSFQRMVPMLGAAAPPPQQQAPSSAPVPPPPAS